MNSFVVISLLGMVACASGEGEKPPVASSVREHLEQPTRLVIGAGTAGVVTAKRWAPTEHAWVAADVPLVIEDGSIDAKVDRDGRVSITDLEIGLAPIQVPEGAIGSAATLDHLRIHPHTKPAPAATTWAGDDVATASGTLDLELAWSVTLDGTSATLGPQHLPPIEAHLAIGGDGATVDGTVELILDGPLWNWIGVIELDDLHLVVSGSSRD